MALQVRLRHALGETVVDLPARGADEPVMIGRAREAELQIPSVSVGPRHCALFVHDGRWVVQGLAGVTRVNGQPVTAPTVLQIGDVITLGTDPVPPSIQIDPAAAAEGRSGPAGELMRAAAPAAARPMTPAAPWAPVPAPAPQTYSGASAPAPAPPPVPPPVQQTYEPPPPEPEQNEDTIDWSPAASLPRSNQYYLPRRKQTSEAGLVLAIVFAILLIGGTALVVYNQLHPKPVVKAPPPPPPTVVQEEPNVHSKLFDVNGDQQKARQTHAKDHPPDQDQIPTPSTDNPTEKPQPQPGDSSDTQSPAASDTSTEKTQPSSSPEDDADNEIESAHLRTDDQGTAILKFDDYRRLHPGRHTKELDKYTEDAANWLWWQRIDQLWKKRNRLTGDIKKAEQDIAAQPAGSFHNQLVKQKEDLEKQRGKTEELLKDEMGYTSDTEPDLKEPRQLQELAKTRDADKYAAFKKRVLQYVRAHHGDVWWKGDE